MNIKQASLASGVSSRNIRYYEQVGLLFLLPRGLLGTWWGILLFAGCIASGISAAWYNTHIFYNDKDNANLPD